MRVRAVPVQPHCFHYGGFDIQMLRTLEVLQSVGVDARPLDFWSRDGDFEILHLWGLEPQHSSLARTAKSYGKKIALTPLLPYATHKNRMKHMLARLAGRRRETISLLRHVDVLLVVNQLQADAAMRLYGFPSKSIEVVPTILSPHFFSRLASDPLPNAPQTYVFCAGNIWPRKNQVRLAKAALAAGCPVIFAGETMGGEQTYTAEFERLVSEHTSLQWHRWLGWEDMYRAVQHASAVALPSFSETQPTIGLEAVALQKPLLLADQPYAQQEFYAGALTVNAASVASITTGLKRILAEPALHAPSSDQVERCRPEFAARQLRSIFERLIA